MKKIIALGVLLVMCMSAGIFSGCAIKKEIEFAIGLALKEDSVDEITKIVSLLEDINKSDIAIDEKYDSGFFANNSLIIIAFQTRTGGGEIEEIKVFKQGNKLLIEINGSLGTAAVISSKQVVLEVEKNAIDSIKKVRLTTNMGKY